MEKKRALVVGLRSRSDAYEVLNQKRVSFFFSVVFFSAMATYDKVYRH